jgi:hypothetical protein
LTAAGKAARNVKPPARRGGTLPARITWESFVNRLFRSIVFVFWVNMLFSTGLAHAQARETQTPALPSGAAQAMALGSQQAQLGKLLGDWDVDIVLSNGATPAQHSKGKAEYSWVVQGRWLGCHLTGQMLGFPYEQFTILGYDSYAKNLVEVAVESADNSMLLSRGAAPQPGHPVTALFGELDEYTTAVLHQPYKVLINRVSADRHVITIVGFDDDGHEVKKVEFTFSRKR